jgi:hypothetical protein
VAPNLLNQNFNPVGENEIWAGDVTYLKAAEGGMYLAIVMGLYSRRMKLSTRKRLKRHFRRNNEQLPLMPDQHPISIDTGLENVILEKLFTSIIWRDCHKLNCSCSRSQLSALRPKTADSLTAMSEVISIWPDKRRPSVLLLTPSSRATPALVM